MKSSHKNIDKGKMHLIQVTWWVVANTKLKAVQLALRYRLVKIDYQLKLILTDLKMQKIYNILEKGTQEGTHKSQVKICLEATLV